MRPLWQSMAHAVNKKARMIRAVGSRGRYSGDGVGIGRFDGIAACHGLVAAGLLQPGKLRQSRVDSMRNLDSRTTLGIKPNTRFDPEKAVMADREAVAQLEAQTNETAKDILRVITRRQREEWATWQGEDSLHEMAFGEPE